MAVGGEVGASQVELAALVEEPVLHLHGKDVSQEQVMAAKLEHVSHAALDAHRALRDRRR